MRVLITGASGFVGPILAKSLLAKGAEIYGFIRGSIDSSVPKRFIDVEIADTIETVYGNLTDIKSVRQALSKSEPDAIFHLGGISHVHYSFDHPSETFDTNISGTSNLLEAIRINDGNPVFVFAGSSEEYGLVLSSNLQYETARERYGVVFPEPITIPELPVTEGSFLRPMSPYAVSKVAGDNISRNYWTAYGLRTVVSRAFNHEGIGRGDDYVTSSIIRQAISLKNGLINKIRLGNITALRDWSGVEDIINGYELLAERGVSGSVYNQGSMRTNSVLTYLLWSLEILGYQIDSIETIKGSKKVDDPTCIEKRNLFGLNFEKTKIDQMLLQDEITFSLKEEGLIIHGPSKPIRVEFDKNLYRPSEVPVMLCDSRKIQDIGASYSVKLSDIIKSQIDHYSLIIK